MPRIRKKTSKRTPTSKRVSIQQKVAESKKKAKKAAKKSTQWKSKTKKDPGIPNNFPYKEQILAEVAETRRKAVEEKELRKAERKKGKSVAKPSAGGDASEDEYDDNPTENDASVADTGLLTLAPSSKAARAPKHQPPSEAAQVEAAPLLLNPALPDLQAALDAADVVLEVLDARDPMSFRSTWIESLTTEAKRTVLVLTKTDLVPRESLEAWAAHLRQTQTVFLFRAASAFIPQEVAAPNKDVQPAKRRDNATDCIGDGVIRGFLAELASQKPAGATLSVAVVGMPNVGKSSLINSFLRRAALPVYTRSSSVLAGQPSTTMRPHDVSLVIGDHTVQLIDTPGMTYTEVGDAARDMLLRNRGRVDRITDPLPAVSYIISRAETEDLMLQYNLPAFAPRDPSAFLTALARARCAAKKDATPDLTTAARLVLKDWSAGHVAWYTHPPGSAQAPVETDPRDAPVLHRAQPRKELRQARGTLVRFGPGTHDERAVDTHAHYDADVVSAAVVGDDSAAQPEVASDASGYESDNNDSPDVVASSDEESDLPAPTKTGTKRKREARAPKPAKKVAFASTASSKEPKSKLVKKDATKMKATPRIGNAGTVKARTTAASKLPNGEEAYDFGKFF